MSRPAPNISAVNRSWIFYLLLGVAQQGMADAPEIPIPKNAKISIVGQDMTVGGKAMSIRQIYTRDKISKVKAFYHSRWAEAEIPGLPGYTENNALEPWHIISRLEEGYLLTVQIQRADDGGTRGYLASSKLSRELTPSKQAESFPKIQGTRIVHDIQSRDAGQRAVTMLLSNHHSLSSNSSYYKNYYQQRGWRIDLDQPMPRAGMYVLAFTHGREKVNIVLTGNENSTKITVNKVVHDIL